MLKKSLLFLFVVLLVAFVMMEPAMAGPGGKIAKAMYESFWGKVVLVLLTILFLPLILYTVMKEKFAERRARKDLRFMAKYNAQFDWLKLKQRATDCFYRIHAAWQKEDVSEASDWMTDWYWQNQQMVYLDRWEQEGLVNVCEVKKLTDIKPLLFVHRNSGAEHEDSMLIISITAKMRDYLAQRDGGKVVEGSKKLKEVETIWSFTMENGVWKVSNIEEDTMSLAYAKMVSELPSIEETVVSELRA